MNLTAETASGFYCLFKANYFRKCETNLRRIFRIGRLSGEMTAVKWGCDCSRDVTMATNLYLFNPHLVFWQPISPKRNEIGIQLLWKWNMSRYIIRTYGCDWQDHLCMTVDHVTFFFFLFLRCDVVVMGCVVLICFVKLSFIFVIYISY